MDRPYKLSNVERRGTWKSQYSTGAEDDMVDYAVAVDGEEGWIKLTQKATTRPPEVGQELYGHVENKKNANGTDYRKFVKAQQQQRGDSGVSNERVEYIVMMLEELTGRRKVEDDVAAVGDAELEDPFAGLGI